MKALRYISIVTFCAMILGACSRGESLSAEQAQQVIEEALGDAICVDTKGVGPWLIERYEALEKAGCLKDSVELDLSKWGRKIFYWDIDPACGTVEGTLNEKRLKGSSFMVKAGTVEIIAVNDVQRRDKEHAFVTYSYRFMPNERIPGYTFSLCRFSLDSESALLPFETKDMTTGKVYFAKTESGWAVKPDPRPSNVTEILPEME